jgi:hypothetical protein
MLLAALALGAGLAGCSPSEKVVHAKLEPAHEYLMKIGTAYVRCNDKLARPPANAGELRPFLSELGNPDELLRSPRDGEPYVICWGVDLRTPLPWARGTSVLAYEHTGASSKRYVLTTMRSVVLLTDTEFRQASFAPGHSPPP